MVTTNHAIAAVNRVVPRLALASFVLLGSVAPRSSDSQTLLAQEAFHQRYCDSWVFLRSCTTVSSRRLTRQFAKQNLGQQVFGGLWGGAAHCVTVAYPSEKCAQSVGVFTDPTWNRIVWGQPGSFLQVYGGPGSGVGEFQQPAGVAITRADGQWHVAYIADVINSRIAVIAVGYTCKCVKWLGSIDAVESGLALSGPYDVAWSPMGTWTTSDDLIFITDTGNNRIVVYQVSPNPEAGSMTASFRGSFGSVGSAADQFRMPQGIDVRNYFCFGSSCETMIYISDTGNHRVVGWHYAAAGSTPNAQTSPDTAAQYLGITHDHYGDVYVVDYSKQKIVKFRTESTFHDQLLTPIGSYGGNGSWYDGNFVSPISAKVTHAYRTNDNVSVIDEGLPLLSTIERWGDTTGIQSHRLGISVQNLTAEVPSGQTKVFIHFTFTATGQHDFTIRNASNQVVYSSNGTLTANPDDYYLTWDAGGFYGHYTFNIRYQSGYTYDDASPQYASIGFDIPNLTSPDPCTANPTAPGCQPPPCADPTLLVCTAASLNAAPDTFLLGQDLTDGPNVIQVVASGNLQRVGAASVLATGTIAAARRTNADIARNGVRTLAFGVPREGASSSSSAGLAEHRATKRVTIRIFDSGGRLVRLAVNEELSPGYYRFSWDGHDDVARALPPGVYIAVMTSHGFSKTSKLILTH